MSKIIGRPGSRYASTTYPGRDSSGAPTPQDHKVKVDGADTTPGFLAVKVAAGGNVSLAVLNPGGDEQLEISVPNADHKFSINGADATADYAEQKLVPGVNMAITVVDLGGGNLVLSFAAVVPPGSSDHKVIVNLADTTPDYLDAKLAAAGGIVLNILNPAGNEQIEIDASGVTGDHKLLVDGADTTPDYLDAKIVGTGGIVATILNPAGNEQLQLSGAAIEALVPLPDHSLTTTAGPTNPLMKIKSFIDVTDHPYLAVSSSSSTTGSITSGSTALTLAAAIDFLDGQSLVQYGAGSAHGLAAPAAPYAIRFGASGTDTQDYKIVAVTSEDGTSVASAQSNQITDAPTTLTSTNFIRVMITPVNGAYRYLVYGRKNSTGAGWSYRGAVIAHPLADQRGQTPQTYFDDTTGAFITPRAPFAANVAQVVNLPNLLRTRAVSGGGTVNLVLADAARSTVVTKTVQHDNILPFQDAINDSGASASDSSGGMLFVPRGNLFRMCGNLFIDRCMLVRTAGGEGDNPATSLLFSDGFGLQIDGSRSGPTWCPGKPIALGQRVEPNVPNGHIYECTTAGITGTTYPTFPTVNGNTVVDGGVTWTARSGLRQAEWAVIEDLHMTWTDNTMPAGRIWARKDLRYVDNPNISAVTRYGSAASPAVTFTDDGFQGNATGFWTVQVEITVGGARGTAQFKWTADGITFTTGVLTAATVLLGATGITANFPNSANYIVGSGYNVRTSDAFPGAAITFRTRARFYRCGTNTVPGSAMVVWGSAGAFSNCNGSYIHGGRHSTGTGWAVYIEGDDANQCLVEANTEAVNFSAGFGDNSFLGSRWHDCYCTGGCTTQTFQNRPGGCHADWMDCYSEGGQASAFIPFPAAWFGGYPASGITGDSTGLILPSKTNCYPFEVHNQQSAIDVWFAFGPGNSTPYIWGWHNSDQQTDFNPIFCAWDTGTQRWDIFAQGNLATMSVCVDDIRGVGLPVFPRGFLAGSTGVNERRFQLSAGLPITPDIWAVGDTLLTTAESLGRIGFRPDQKTGTGTAWAANTQYKTGTVVINNGGVETTPGSLYVCSQHGTSGASAPNPWAGTGGTTVDGTAHWLTWGLSIATLGDANAMQVIPNNGAPPVDLTNADLTKGIADGYWFVDEVNTLTGNHTLTLSATGAIKGDQIHYTREDVNAFTRSIINGGPGANTMDTFPVSKRGSGTYQFDGTNWRRKHSESAP